MIRVYRFGLLRPTQNSDLVYEQLRAAHLYRNKLTEVECARRAALRELLSAQGDTKALEIAVEVAERIELEAVKTIRDARSSTHKRSETKEMRERLTMCRAGTRSVKIALQERRHQLRSDPALQAAKDAIEEHAAEARRKARSETTCYWGSYLLCEDADMASRKMPLYDGAEPNDPRFHRFSGEGRIGVQLQNGMPVEKLFSVDTRLRIAPVDSAAWYAEKRSDRRRASRTVLWMRVGTDPKTRGPIWTTWPMIMHREIPAGSVLKGAIVNLRKIGPRDEWYVTITAEIPELAFATCGKGGTVAVDLGWRRFDDGLRVAAWGGKNGESGELRLTNATISSLRKAEELRSIRDTNFDVARMKLSKVLSTMKDVPEWLKAKTENLSQWKSPGRLAALAKVWKTEREKAGLPEIRVGHLNGETVVLDSSSASKTRRNTSSSEPESDAADAKIMANPVLTAAYTDLELWRYHDYHLWSWETSQRTKKLRNRREQYRIFADMLAKKYSTLVLEKFDLREIAKKQAVDDEKADNQTARSNRQLAAVSELRLVLVNTFVGRGGTVEKIDAADTTITCHSCGVVEKFDAAAQVHHTCSACGTVADQDVQAWKNLLIRLERERSKENVATARKQEKQESRWVRARRMAAEKGARKDTARKEEQKEAE
jgi:transposase